MRDNSLPDAINWHLPLRQILYTDSDEEAKEYYPTSGIWQESVLGSSFWKNMNDEIVSLRLPNEVFGVGFADDIALMITAKYIDEVELIPNEGISVRTD